MTQKDFRKSNVSVILQRLHLHQKKKKTIVGDHFFPFSDPDPITKRQPSTHPSILWVTAPGQVSVTEDSPLEQ